MGALRSLDGNFVLKPEAGEKCIFKNTHLCVKPPHKGLVASEVEVIQGSGQHLGSCGIILLYICQKQPAVKCIEQQKGLDQRNRPPLGLEMSLSTLYYRTGLNRAVNEQEPL